jgi:hypothetical protein
LLNFRFLDVQHQISAEMFYERHRGQKCVKRGLEVEKVLLPISDYRTIINMMKSKDKHFEVISRDLKKKYEN